ncbi:uncharacterized protein [Epargyreus clarus]|uniref:uncharacterized protein n=1 Tax=Epargyreus clarus TaxID=520877 RepID=UPI003C2EC946
MCQRNIFSRSFIRIAEEVQLQAEQEWIVEALRRIKQQRNCLQIERLQLESLKAKLKEPESAPSKETKAPDYNNHVSAVDMMNPTLGNKRPNDEFEGMEDDTTCNDEELNLMVHHPLMGFNFQEKVDAVFNYGYEEDEDDEEDDDDGDNVMIDINMLMNGNM